MRLSRSDTTGVEMKDRPVSSLPRCITINRTFILSLGEWTWPYVNKKRTRKKREKTNERRAVNAKNLKS